MVMSPYLHVCANQRHSALLAHRRQAQLGGSSSLDDIISQLPPSGKYYQL